MKAGSKALVSDCYLRYSDPTEVRDGLDGDLEGLGGQKEEIRLNVHPDVVRKGENQITTLITR